MHRWIQCLLWCACLVVPVEVLQTGNACAPAPPRNQPVEIAQESAIIIWDEANKTQHFIRRASFVTSAADFGFIVPSPTVPELHKAPDAAFDTLADYTKPEVIEKKRPRRSSGGGGCGCAGMAPMDEAKSGRKGALPAPAVRVLASQRVGAYDTKTIEADNADALETWLEENGYYFSPELKTWSEPYIDLKWKFTAFKIAATPANEEDETNKGTPEGENKDKQPAGNEEAKPEEKKPDASQEPADWNAVATHAVRMTFKTDKPFFPYREPQSEPGENKPLPGMPVDQRLLRVFFLGSHKVKGTLGETDPFVGETVWANKLKAEQLKKVAEQLEVPAELLPEGTWLTEFEDRSSPRPGTDEVFFSQADDEQTVKRQPHIKYVQREQPPVDFGLSFYVFATCLVSLSIARVMRKR